MIPKGLPGEGNILVFDNGGQAGYGSPNPGAPTGHNNAIRPYSRVLEFDPGSAVAHDLSLDVVDLEDHVRRVGEIGGLLGLGSGLGRSVRSKLARAGQGGG